MKTIKQKDYLRSIIQTGKNGLKVYFFKATKKDFGKNLIQLDIYMQPIIMQKELKLESRLPITLMEKSKEENST
jgi:hypothetical protein